MQVGSAVASGVIRLGRVTDVKSGWHRGGPRPEDMPRVRFTVSRFKSPGSESKRYPRLIVVLNDRALDALGNPGRVGLSVSHEPRGFFIYPDEDEGKRLLAHGLARRRIVWSWSDVMDGLGIRRGEYLPAKVAEDDRGRSGLFVEVGARE